MLRPIPLTLTLVLAVAFAAGCMDVTIHEAPDAEGDDPGECSDDADNDGNGLYDCEDPACAGSEACDENLAPSAPVAAIDPTEPGTGDTLRCYVTEPAVDPEGLPVTYAYSWRLDGVAVDEVEEAEVDPELTERGQSWECTVAGSDGEATGPAASVTVSIGNTPPGAPGVSIIPGTPNPQDDLFCSITSPSFDADGDEVTYSYEWVSAGEPSGHTDQQLAWYTTEPTQSWACLVRPFDGYDEGAQGEDSVDITTDLWPHVAAGRWHSCSVHMDSTTSCWGDDEAGQATLPPMGSWTVLTAGEQHTCGLSFPDLAVGCWGDDSRGQGLTPAASFVQLDSGVSHICGVTWNGLVLCWGSSDDWEDFTPPPDIAVQVSGGDEFSCALLSTGAIDCWGDVPFSTPAGTDYLEIDAGGRFLCALDSTLELQCWGDDGDGQVSGALDFSGVAFSTVSAGNAHACAVEQATGVVRCWGRDVEGQQSQIPNGQFVDVSAGWTHSCGIRPSGAVLCWGCSGQYTGPCAL